MGMTKCQKTKMAGPSPPRTLATDVTSRAHADDGGGRTLALSRTVAEDIPSRPPAVARHGRPRPRQPFDRARGPVQNRRAGKAGHPLDHPRTAAHARCTRATNLGHILLAGIDLDRRKSPLKAGARSSAASVALRSRPGEQCPSAGARRPSVWVSAPTRPPMCDLMSRPLHARDEPRPCPSRGCRPRPTKVPPR